MILRKNCVSNNVGELQCYNQDMHHTILVVEDEESVRTYIRDVLLENGYVVSTAEDGIEALNYVKKNQPDVILLDLGLPNIRGEAVCKQVKKLYPDIQIIILTAQDTTPDIIKGLDIGADDYMIKPFEIEEVLARIKARLRVKNPVHEVLKIGNLTLDSARVEVKRNNKLIELTPQEFKLLEYLMHNKGRVLSRTMILDRLWEFSPDIETRVVDVYIGYLRKKLDTKNEQTLIKSVRGFGYTIRE